MGILSLLRVSDAAQGRSCGADGAARRGGKASLEERACYIAACLLIANADQIACKQEYPDEMEERLVNEEYKIWKKNTPFLYGAHREAACLLCP